ncbi:MAG TPA: hypothetical protein VN436_17395, partial [Holophaga sp.]|nr:hypothetical protein [Holophaga sp.]
VRQGAYDEMPERDRGWLKDTLYPPKEGEVPAFTTADGLRIFVREGGVLGATDSVAFDADNRLIAGEAGNQTPAAAVRQLYAARQAKIAAGDAEAEAMRDTSPGAPREVATSQDVERFMDEHRAWMSGQTSEQRYAMLGYQQDSQNVNEPLRRGEPLSDWAQSIHDRLVGLVVPTAEKLRTFRGVDLNTLGGEVRVGSEISDKGWGSTTLSRGIGLDYAVAAENTAAHEWAKSETVRPGLFEITLPAGTRHIPMMRGYNGEQKDDTHLSVDDYGEMSASSQTRGQWAMGEVVMPPEMRYRVTGSYTETHNDQDVTIYTMEAQP